MVGVSSCLVGREVMVLRVLLVLVDVVVLCVIVWVSVVRVVLLLFSWVFSVSSVWL